MAEKMLTAEEAAKILGMTPHGVRRLIRVGILRAQHFGPAGPRGLYLIAASDLRNLKRPRRGRPKKESER